MTHYVPVQLKTGYAVAYLNHREELIPVMECITYGAAYREAAAMTLEATKRAICGAEPLRQDRKLLRDYL